MRKKTIKELNEYLHKFEDDLNNEIEIKLYEKLNNIEKKISDRSNTLDEYKASRNQVEMLERELNEAWGIIKKLSDSVEELSNRSSKNLHDLYYKNLSDIEKNTLIMASIDQLIWFPIMYTNRYDLHQITDLPNSDYKEGCFNYGKRKNRFKYFRKLTPEEKKEVVK